MSATGFRAYSHLDEFLRCAKLGITFKRLTSETLGVSIEDKNTNISNLDLRLAGNVCGASSGERLSASVPPKQY
jgi:hypothetical protein